MTSVLLCIAAIVPQHEGPHIHVQEVDGVRYFQVRLRAPSGYRLPKAQRQGLDRIAPHDLGRYPRLIPLDTKARLVAWHFSTSSSFLEFVGIFKDLGGSGKFRLLVPIEDKDNPNAPSWFDREITLLFDEDEIIRTPKPMKRKPEAPDADDLAGRWAAAWAREFAVRERLANDALEFRVARQELCRQFGIADPLPRPIPEPLQVAEANVDLRELRTIEAADHPWPQWLAGRDIRVEPMARLIPADFYYCRIRTTADGIGLLEQALSTIQTAWRTWQADGQNRRLWQRYWRQLALPVDESGRPRWPQHIREVAVTGSDFHFSLGTDITLLFALSDEEAFRRDLDSARPAAAPADDGHFDHRGVTVQTRISSDQRIRQHFAVIGGVAVVSNSGQAIRRVIDVMQRQAASLADMPEFRVMRGLFPIESPAEDVLLFVSETFQREQFNPRHRILLKRRLEEATADQVLRGRKLFEAWRSGKPLVDALPPGDLPLLERPLERVTKAEDEWYQEFSEVYRTEWKPYLAPAAFRLQRRGGLIRVEAFIMAPRQADFWDAVRNKLGSGTVARESSVPQGTAARVIASVKLGEMDRARLNQWLISKGVDRKHLTARVDWMGDRLVFHLPDHEALAHVLDHYWHVDLTAEDLSKSRSDGTGRWLLTQVPATLAVEIARPLFFQGTLKKVREIVEETWPKTMKWESLGEDGRRIVLNRIQPAPALLMLAFGKLLKPEESPGIYLAHGERMLVVAGSLESLRGGIAREITGRRRDERERAAAWFSLIPAASSIRKALLDVGERSAHRQALAAIAWWQWLHECGIQEEELAWQHLGFVPSAADGSALWVDQGEVTNQRHGSPRAPRLQEASTNSPWAKMLQQAGLIRGEVHVRPDGILAVAVIGQP
ncbi:MAG: hypothetical protein N2039_00290 [Gemmataceae bacterium]|nr:hypothetical protein [Gemmataceae bacterium]